MNIEIWTKYPDLTGNSEKDVQTLILQAATNQIKVWVDSYFTVTIEQHNNAVSTGVQEEQEKHENKDVMKYITWNGGRSFAGTAERLARH